MIIPTGFIMFASDDSDDAVKDARDYIRRMGLTRDDCRIVRRDDQTLVILERDYVKE